MTTCMLHIIYLYDKYIYSINYRQNKIKNQKIFIEKEKSQTTFIKHGPFIVLFIYF